MKILSFLPLLFFLACQAPQQAPLPQLLAQSRTPQAVALMTAKLAGMEADLLAQKWAPAAALTHVLGQSITQEGLPHRSNGSWTFSYINQDRPDQGFQVHYRNGQFSAQKIQTKSLPQTEALEVRAWGLDSNRAVMKARQLSPQTGLKRLELTQIEGRLVWAFEGKPLLEAMNGQPYQPLR